MRSTDISPKYAQIQGGVRIEPVFSASETVQIAERYAELVEKIYTYQGLTDKQESEAELKRWRERFSELSKTSIKPTGCKASLVQDVWSPNPMGMLLFACDNCRGEFPETWNQDIPEYKFCPHCGEKFIKEKS